MLTFLGAENRVLNVKNPLVTTAVHFNVLIFCSYFCSIPSYFVSGIRFRSNIDVWTWTGTFYVLHFSGFLVCALFSSIFDCFFSIFSSLVFVNVIFGIFVAKLRLSWYLIFFTPSLFLYSFWFCYNRPNISFYGTSLILFLGKKCVYVLCMPVYGYKMKQMTHELNEKI